MLEKKEIVKKYLNVMKIEKKDNNMYYLKFRKCKSNKINVNQYYEILKLENENVIKLSDYELLITENEINYIYNLYIEKIYDKSF